MDSGERERREGGERNEQGGSEKWMGAEVELEWGEQDQGLKHSPAPHLLQLLSMNGGKERCWSTRSKGEGWNSPREAETTSPRVLCATQGVCTAGLKQGRYFRNKKGHGTLCQVGMESESIQKPLRKSGGSCCLVKDDVSKRGRQDWEKSHVLGCGNRTEEDAHRGYRTHRKKTRTGVSPGRLLVGTLISGIR